MWLIDHLLFRIKKESGWEVDMFVHYELKLIITLSKIEIACDVLDNTDENKEKENDEMSPSKPILDEYINTQHNNKIKITITIK